MISIVIPTRNSEKDLAACLSSIRSQDFRDYEIIIVDSFSSDRTGQIAGDFGCTMIKEDSITSKARNTGFAVAKGETLMSLDSDMVLEEGLLSEVSQIKADAIIIAEEGIGKSYFGKCKSLEKKCYLGDPDVETARVFSRAAFDSVSGYNDSLLLGEDWDINQRIARKYAVARTSRRVFHNMENTGFMKTIRKCYRYGRSLPDLLKGNPESKRLAQRPFFFFSRFSILAADPIHAFGLLFIKCMEYAAVLAGFVSRRIGI